MDEKVKELYLKQLKEIQNEWERDQGVIYNDDERTVQVLTRAERSIKSITGEDSTFAHKNNRIIQDIAIYKKRLQPLMGVVSALIHDIEAGYLDSVEEQIHGEMFSDYLEMADHLLKDGFKDAAAVIAGSTLEAHLRQLCTKAGIEIEIETNKRIANKKADVMNADLKKAEVYGKQEQKQMAAWLDLRNNAAHGNYEEYVKGQVALMIDGIRDFIFRHPA